MKTTQKGTEGILNKINERYGCNQKRRTIAIQNLIRFHKPKTKYALLELIKSHHKDNTRCECGCVANGGIDDWAQNLYNSYLKYKQKEPNIPYKNLEDCKIFMNYLFVEGSIKGGLMEKETLRILKTSKLIKEFGMKVKMGTEEHDFKYSVDIVIYDSKNNEVMGIQVKPNSYKGFKKSDPVYMNNQKKNELYGKEVLYIYYNKSGKFVGNDAFNKELNRILLQHKSSSIRAVAF